MLGSVVIDVAIGLILIYLLYSLLTTAIQEALSSFFAFRARILSKGIDRMLNDEPSTLRESFEYSYGKWRKLYEWLMSLFIYVKVQGRNTLADRFYNEPLIKYMGASKIFPKPSYITAENFSQALLQILLDNGTGNNKSEKIKNALLTNGTISGEHFVSKYNSYTDITDPVLKIKKVFSESQALRDNDRLREFFSSHKAAEVKNISDNTYVAFCEMTVDYQRDHLLIEPETRQQLLSFYSRSNGDLDKFEQYLKSWFEDTMERVSGWYKKRTQIRLFIWGLILAIVFNINTFQIVSHLSNDDKARKEASDLALAYYTSNKNLNSADSALAKKAYEQAVKASLKDIDNAHSTFSISYPWVASDSLKAFNKAMEARYDLFKKAKLYGNPSDSLLKDTLMLQYDALQRTKYLLTKDTNKVRQDSLKKVMVLQKASLDATIRKNNLTIPEEWPIYRKLKYIFSPWRFLSFIITALAISLGAPFWFDLLNKFINIRGAGAKPSESKKEDKTDKTKIAAG